MRRGFYQDAQTDSPQMDDEYRSLVRSTQVFPQPPKSFKVVNAGNGVRCTAVGRGKIAGERALSGAVRYAVHWCEDLDFSTDEGIKAGFARSTIIGDMVAPQVEDKEATLLIKDTRYTAGWFFCTGVTANGDESIPTPPTQVTVESSDESIPPDVSLFFASESGEELNGTVISATTYVYRCPSPRGSFAGVQPYLKHYPNINDVTQLPPDWYNGPAGGAGSGVVRLPVARRYGAGTITTISGAANAVITGSGTAFTEIARAGDWIEILGVMGEIQSVDSNTQVTLTGSWASFGGSFFSGFAAAYTVVASVTMYAVSISRAGVRRPDIENSPSADLVLDGLLSAPVAPASLTLTPFDNGVRAQFRQLDSGIGIRGYRVWRNVAPGTTDYLSTARDGSPLVTLLTEIPHDARVLSGAGISLLQFEDTNFTVAQREDQASFRYYVDTVNVRGQRSTNYSTAEAVCRLTKPSDTDPFVPSRSGAKNFLYNACFSGTSGAAVDRADAAQDDFQADLAAAVTPDTNAGADTYVAATGGGPGTVATAPYFGFSRWHTVVSAGSRATHQNGDEVVFTAPGAGQTSFLYQDIGGWTNSSGTARNQFLRRRIKKGAIFVLHFKAIKSGTIAGNFDFYLEQYNVSAPNTYAVTAIAAERYRDSNDDLEWHPFDATSKVAIYDDDISSSTWSWFFATFKTDDSVECDFLRVVFAWNAGTANTISIKEPMLSLGEELFAWTPEMHLRANPNIPGNITPFEIGDRGGSRGFTPELP